MREVPLGNLSHVRENPKTSSLFGYGKVCFRQVPLLEKSLKICFRIFAMLEGSKCFNVYILWTR